MGKFSTTAFGALTAVFVLTAYGQDVVYPGSTPQGDVLRGQGQFLKGAAWYELNKARGDNINAKTAIELDKWNRQVYEDYMRHRSAHLQRRANLTKAQSEAAQQRYEEREERLRTNPTADDLSKGDALNALLIDLSNPAINATSWRLAQVPLTDGLSIRSLVFQFAAKPGDKNSLSSALIALGRLDMKGRWPVFLSSKDLEQERNGYDAAYGRVLDESLKAALTLDTVLGLDKAISALKAGAVAVVPPERGFRASASRFVDDLKAAAKVFDADTISYAQEMIADTNRHDARTVGELLAFMRKYRLLFAREGAVSGGGAAYGRLYGLLREQKELLGIKTGGEVAAKGPKPDAARVVKTTDPDPALLKAALLGKVGAARESARIMRFDRTPENRAPRAAALKALDAAKRDVEAGRSPGHNLADALKSLEELGGLVKAPGHVKNTKMAITSLKEAIAMQK